MKERLSLENICKTITNPRPRRDIYLYDMDAVNEVLVNAIIHNDYRITDPQVSFFDDRLEIVSHGGLPLGLTSKEFFEGVSRPRNESLMDIFKRLGIVEHTGHGIPTVISKYGKDIFDRERYERIREISAEIMAYKTDIPVQKVKDLFCMKQDTRHQNLIPEPLFFKMEKFFLLKRIAENGHFPEVGLM